MEKSDNGTIDAQEAVDGQTAVLVIVFCLVEEVSFNSCHLHADMLLLMGLECGMLPMVNKTRSLCTGKKIQ